MYLHGHIKQVVDNCGPVFGFWLFSLERYNGILGNLIINSTDIESQLLKRFLGDNIVFSFDFHQNLPVISRMFIVQTSVW